MANAGDTALYQSSSKSSLQSNGLSERSSPLNSLSSSCGIDDQEDILTSQAHVRDIYDALAKLRNAFPGNESDTDSDGKIMKLIAIKCYKTDILFNIHSN